MYVDGSVPVYRPAPQRSFWRSPVEFGARIVFKAGGKGLGTMAKAGHPIGGDRLQQRKGVSTVPCVIQSLSRASGDLRGDGSGRRSREASNASVMPRLGRRAWRRVRVVFQAVLAIAVMLGVACGASSVSPEEVSVEFGARIVFKAGGKGLGTMAKAGHPIGGDRLLYSAG